VKKEQELKQAKDEVVTLKAEAEELSEESSSEESSSEESSASSSQRFAERRLRRMVPATVALQPL
jgi:hypothetical protein